MNDIKKRKRVATQTSTMQEPDLTFLQDKNLDTKHITQPTHGFQSITTYLKQPFITHTVVGAILFGLGLGIGSTAVETRQITNSHQTEKNITLEQDAAPTVAGSFDRIFADGTYYKIELVSGDIYYAQVALMTDVHYTIENVFYTIAETSQDSGQEKITLALYEQEAGETTRQVLLPREQVKAVSPLEENSSIVTAINDYINEVQATQSSVPQETIE